VAVRVLVVDDADAMREAVRRVLSDSGYEVDVACTLAEARDLLTLAREGKITPIPTRDRPLNEAQTALDDLRAGRVVGRTVLSV